MEIMFVKYNICLITCRYICLCCIELSTCFVGISWKNSHVLRFVVCFNFDSAGPQSPKKVIKKSNNEHLKRLITRTVSPPPKSAHHHHMNEALFKPEAGPPAFLQYLHPPSEHFSGKHCIPLSFYVCSLSMSLFIH